jgi:hypothetical protein
VISFCLPFGPTRAVFRAYASDGSKGVSWPPTKSENEGPAFSLSAKRVARTRGLLVGDSTMVGSGVVVANDRGRVGEYDVGRKTRNGEGDERPLRQRYLDAEAAMIGIADLELLGGVVVDFSGFNASSNDLLDDGTFRC